MLSDKPGHWKRCWKLLTEVFFQAIPYHNGYRIADEVRMSKLRRTPYDAVFFSAHLDDVVFCCGGLIASLVKKKQRVLVATIFTRENPRPIMSPDIRRFLQQSGVKTAAKLFVDRRKEDQNALELLGCDFVHCGFVDGLWRTSQDGERLLYPSFQQIFNSPTHAVDAALIRLIEQQSKQLMASSPRATLYAPLGIGRHIDHRVTFQAVRRASQALKRDITFYEDVPYRHLLTARAFRLAELSEQWRFTQFHATEKQAQLKAAACRAYTSQFPAIQANGLGEIDYYQEGFFTT